MKVTLKSKLSDSTNSLFQGAQRNAFPASEQRVTLKKNQITGKFITGYDLEYGEDYEAILKTPKHPKYELMKERQLIENALNVSLDGDKDNEFLLHTRIPLCTRKTLEEELNLGEPLDKFYYKALIANGYVAATKEDLYGSGNRNILYYFSSPQKEESSRKSISRIKNELAGKLSTFEENKIWLLAMSNKLNLAALPDMSAEALYNNLDELKNKISSLAEAEKMKAAFSTDFADLQHSFVCEIGNKYYYIATGANGVKMVDDRNVGANMEEAKANLKTEKYSESFGIISKKVFAKYKIN